MKGCSIRRADYRDDPGYYSQKCFKNLDNGFDSCYMLWRRLSLIRVSENSQCCRMTWIAFMVLGTNLRTNNRGS